MAAQQRPVELQQAARADLATLHGVTESQITVTSMEASKVGGQDVTLTYEVSPLPGSTAGNAASGAQPTLAAVESDLARVRAQPTLLVRTSAMLPPTETIEVQSAQAAAFAVPPPAPPQSNGASACGTGCIVGAATGAVALLGVAVLVLVRRARAEKAAAATATNGQLAAEWDTGLRDQFADDDVVGVGHARPRTQTGIYLEDDGDITGLILDAPSPTPALPRTEDAAVGVPSRRPAVIDEDFI